MARYMCTATTRNGEPCKNVCAVGHDMCYTHVIHERRNGPCAYCLECTDKPILRDTLACGHTFHTECLQQYGVPICGLCRARMTPEEATRILGFPKFGGTIKKIFTIVEPSDIPYVYRSMDKVVNIAARGKWQAEYLSTMLDMFEVACIIVENSTDPNVFGRQPEIAMSEMMDLFNKAYFHLASNSSFEGFGVDGFQSRLYAYSQPVTVVPQPVFDAPLPTLHINIPVPVPVEVAVAPVVDTGAVEMIQYDRIPNLVLDGTRQIPMQ